jgi:hypothetical protein
VTAWEMLALDSIQAGTLAIAPLIGGCIVVRVWST